MTGAALVVFCGLPGVGKTSLSRPTAQLLGATFLRIDTIEVAVGSALAPVHDSPVGYVVAAAVAADQLRAGRPVVVDAVNADRSARDTWHELAATSGVPVRFVEVTCRDLQEHRRRVESRTADLPGHVVPTWDEVAALDFAPIVEPHLSVDNAGAAGPLVARIVAWLG